MTISPNIARRGLLAAFAGLPALAAVSAMATPHADAELLALARQHAEAGALYNAKAAEALAAHMRAEAETPAPPVMLHDDWYTSPRDAGKPYTGREVARWREGMASEDIGLGPASMARFRQRGAEILAAWDARLIAHEAAKQRHACTALEAAADAAGQAHYALEDRVFEQPATTSEGLKVKAQLAADILGDEPDGTYEDHLVRNILADLLALDA